LAPFGALRVFALKYPTLLKETRTLISGIPPESVDRKHTFVPSCNSELRRATLARWTHFQRLDERNKRLNNAREAFDLFPVRDLKLAIGYLAANY
jgi:hypothetical protein